jgi:hypothetical protein
VLGAIHPEIVGLTPQVNEDSQRRFVDLMWERSLTEFVCSVGEDGFPRDDPYGALSTETNAERDRHGHEITSFERAYEIEVRGALDAMGDTAMDIIVEWAQPRRKDPLFICYGIGMDHECLLGQERSRLDRK